MGYKSRPEGWRIAICLKIDCKNKDKECINCIKYNEYKKYTSKDK